MRRKEPTQLSEPPRPISTNEMVTGTATAHHSPTSDDHQLTCPPTPPLIGGGIVVFPQTLDIHASFAELIRSGSEDDTDQSTGRRQRGSPPRHWTHQVAEPARGDHREGIALTHPQQPDQTKATTGWQAPLLFGLEVTAGAAIGAGTGM